MELVSIGTSDDSRMPETIMRPFTDGGATAAGDGVRAGQHRCYEPEGLSEGYHSSGRDPLESLTILSILRLGDVGGQDVKDPIFAEADLKRSQANVL